MTETVSKKKAKPRIEAHNLGTHEERILKRRAVQRLRTASVRVKTGYYTPGQEDVKRKIWREAMERINA